MSFKRLVMAMLLVLFAPVVARGQIVSGPQPQGATLNGFATDPDEAAIPGATITIDGPPPGEHREVKADETGYFLVLGLHPAVPYHLSATAPGFGTYTSPEFTLTPGQVLTLDDVKMPAALGTTITVMPTEEIAAMEVKAEIQQKVLGVIPNFYVVYQKDNVVPLTAKLKFELAYKSSINPVSFVAAAFVAGIDQGLDTPNYVQGAKGFGQRMGAAYADGTTDILIGGALLPALLHQDPRYFYQGTGTKKSRAMHALASPFFCRGDNGLRQFNYSSIGGDFAASALTEIYYPPSNRGVGLLFDNAAVTTVGRMANAILQEFVLSRFTTRGKPQP